MVGILAQVDDIFSWAPRGGKLLGTRWGMRIQGHGYSATQLKRTNSPTDTVKAL